MCKDPATTEIYTLSLHDALPICFLLLLGAIAQATEWDNAFDPANDPELQRANALMELGRHGDAVKKLRAILRNALWASLGSPFFRFRSRRLAAAIA